MNLAARILKDVSTLADGQTYDLAKLFAIFIIPLYMSMGWVQLLRATTEHPFDFNSYGIGFGAILAGLGAFLFLKKDTEPVPVQSYPAPKEKRP